MDLNRHLREHLAFRCGFNEIFTYPWIDEKYIKAAKIDMAKGVRLATPPAPELATLRQSLVPGALEAVVKTLGITMNLRFSRLLKYLKRVNSTRHQKMKHYQSTSLCLQV